MIFFYYDRDNPPNVIMAYAAVGIGLIISLILVYLVFPFIEYVTWSYENPVSKEIVVEIKSSGTIYSSYALNWYGRFELDEPEQENKDSIVRHIKCYALEETEDFPEDLSRYSKEVIYNSSLNEIYTEYSALNGKISYLIYNDKIYIMQHKR